MKTKTNTDQRSRAIRRWVAGLAMLLIGTPLLAQQITIAGGSTVTVGAGSIVTTTGGITIADSGAIQNSGTIQVGGDWTNNGNGLINDSAGIVEFNGTSPQMITGNAVTNFSNLTVNNARGVTLNSDAVVSQLLTFVNGKVTTDSNDIRLTNPCLYPVSGADFNRYIATTRSGRAIFRFDALCALSTVPIGDAYAPVTLTVNGVSGGVVDVAFYTTTGTNPHENSPKLNASGIDQAKKCDHYWVISKSGPGIWTTYTALFDFTHTANTGNPAKYVIRQYDSATGWTSPASSVSGTTITVAGLSSFSEFEIGELVGPSDVPGAQTLAEFNAEVYPNPAVDKLTVKFNSTSSGSYSIKVIDLIGGTVMHQEGKARIGVNVHELRLGDLARGVYILNLERQGDAKQIFRVVVQ